jgi:hypothetical protein
MSLVTITGGGSFTRQNISDINSNFNSLALQLAGTTGNVIYCSPGSSFLGTQTGSISAPYTSLVTAYSAARNAMNDVIVLVGDGTTSATARVTASFTWSKNATHLVGEASLVPISNRARIAPTSTATAYTPFFTISGNGCQFVNVQWFMGFTTGTTNQIGILLTGSRNAFYYCHIAGLADAASAADAGSRTIKIGLSGSGENYFKHCTIGVDTVTRSAANATIEFTAATTRNIFEDCYFPIMTSAATPLVYYGTGTECIDRFQVFNRCLFLNATSSTSTALTGLGTLPASAGGYILFQQSTMVGSGEWGTDATTRGQCYIDGLTGAAATSGVAVNPT